VPIDAVGIETHLTSLSLIEPKDYEEDFRWFLEEAKQANVKVLITEADVYEGPNNDWQYQKALYKTIVKTCLSYSNCIAFFTWGLTDNESWLRNPPPDPNIPDADPLLFDRNYQRKPAYYGVMEAIKEDTTRPCRKPTAAKQGDLNRDGRVDIFDYNILVADFGKTGTPGWIPSDINGNGKVDIFDYNILVENFGK